MFLASAGAGPEAPLDVTYAFCKLKRWMAEGPTERNKKMAQFILTNGYLGFHRGEVPEDALLLMDLAVEWNDFAMWEAVLKKSGSEGNPQRLGSAPLIRVWNVFPFNVTRPMLVPSQFQSQRYTHDLHFNCSLQIRKVHSSPTEHEGRGRIYPPFTVFSFPGSIRRGSVVWPAYGCDLLIDKGAKSGRSKSLCKHRKNRRADLLLGHVRSNG